MNTITTNSVHAFDAAAASYDDTFERNSITEHIRSIISNRMLSHFHAGQRVLDINCGTGTDAILLAQHDISVTAIDASSRMIEIARAKSVALGVADFIETRVSTYHDFNSSSEQSYDGVISNFGGLNCTSDLESVMKNVYSLLKPNGIFIACLMNKVCLWEISSFLARGKFREGFRRLQTDGVEARLGNTTVHTWYYSPGQFARRISRWFAVEKTYGINIFSPSPNSKSFTANYPRLTMSLLNIDRYVRNISPFNALGDHFVIEARKRSQ